MRKRLWLVVVLSSVLVSRQALADAATAVPAAPPSSGMPPALPPTSAASSNQTSSAGSDSKVAAGILLGLGAVAVGVGAYVGISHDKPINSLGEQSNLQVVGAGVAMGGVVLAMVGTYLWLRVPQTGTVVAVNPTGLVFSRSF